MKGKYANKAQKRREIMAAEENASNAEEARADAEAALNEYRETAENKIGRLQERLSAALAERDAATAPRIAELEQQVEAMRQRCHDADAKIAAAKRKLTSLARFTEKLLCNLTGCTPLEALEKMAAMVKGVSEIILIEETSGAGQKRMSPDETKTLQRVRGRRSSPQVIAHLDGLIEAATGRGE